MGDLPFRFYNITVTGIDSAGNVGSDSCQVIIMPNCFPAEDGCRDASRSKYGQGYKFYSTREEVDAIINNTLSSRVFYGIAESKLLKKPQQDNSTYHGFFF